MGFLKQFTDFATRGNLIDMAIGFTVGASFTTIAKSIVTDIVMPPIGLALGETDFSNLYVLLKKGEEGMKPYATLAEAQAAGAVTINYGVFLNNLLAFILVAFVMFLIVRFLNKMEDNMEAHFKEPANHADPMKKKCEYCRTTIPFKATRCPQCTSELELENATPV